MIGGPLRLRSERAVHTRRRSPRLRWPLTGAIFAVIVGAACWAPLASPVLAPTEPVDRALPAPAPTPAAGLPVAAVVARIAPAIAPAVDNPIPTPTIAPTPYVVPTLTATGLSLLSDIKSDRAAQWVKNHTETPLRSGPSDDATMFTRLPQWSLLKQIDTRPDWMLVQYSGDGDTRQPGPGWVRASDVGAVDAPPLWLTSASAGTLWSAPDASAKRLVDLPPTTAMEVIGPDYVQGTRVHVRLPGDGRVVPPSQGWIDGDTAARGRTPSASDLPRGYPEDLRAEVRINVPYRTQLDGSDYEEANCGPTALGMALESFGMNLAAPDLREQVLDAEDFDPADADAGSYIWALARVAESNGIHSHGLYESDGSLHRWSADEIRATVRQGQPVIVQVVYRALPGREDSGYYGDHYVIITGLLGDNFLYNDPIGGAAAHESSPGYDRVMTPAQLQRATRASDTGYAYTAFSLARN
jgi:Peptidase_C39 like family